MAGRNVLWPHDAPTMQPKFCAVRHFNAETKTAGAVARTAVIFPRSKALLVYPRWSLDMSESDQNSRHQYHRILDRGKTNADPH